ncbi:hypothetical protein KGA66_21740 [Actinocrinis puniceicyclus]|uniref:Uncharacterized protein n=1 Tax=Actinocrinis puniceicyclus TaxID=977794 RepID=A0A8J7WV26_9ACTN|nr:hypothetical protein [Actinocrinis puniceicyclus]MBS2965689.1 hypothetical protein [Actinocrinis puniceicyclus]
MHVPRLHDPVVSVIAAGPDEVVPEGLVWEDVHLPSLHTDEVGAWIDEHRNGTVFVVPGVELASEGTPALAVNVTNDEYLAIVSAMPR